VANLIGQDRLIQAKPSITTVGQVANKPVSIAIDQPVVRALDIMHSRRVDTLLVTDAEQHLKGVVSIEKINEYYHSGKTVGEIMDPNVFYVNENSIIRDTVDRILKRGLRNVPVVDNDRKLVGIVTRATLVDIVYDALFTDDGITTDSSTDASSKSEEQKEKDGDQ
jgi:osmoprotectant transport system ATP-binding protein